MNIDKTNEIVEKDGKEYKCNICGGNNFNSYPYHRYKGFEIFVCKNCDFGSTVPMPITDLKGYYEKKYHSKYRSVQYTKEDMILKPCFRAISQYDVMASHINFGGIKSLLDFGSGVGATPRTIKRRNPHIFVTLIEKDENLIKLLNTSEDVDKVYKDLFSVEESYDLIISSHILEHLINIKLVIQKIKSLLNPKGIWYIEVPNCPSNLYYENNLGHFPHVLFFTSKSIDEIANRNNFEVLYNTGVGYSIDFYNRKNKEGVKLGVILTKATGEVNYPNRNGQHVRAILRLIN